MKPASPPAGRTARLRDILGGEPDQQVAQLSADLGLPAGLGAMGVTEAMLDPIAGEALRDHCHATNPRLASREDYRALLAESW